MGNEQNEKLSGFLGRVERNKKGVCNAHPQIKYACLLQQRFSSRSFKKPSRC
jgi:hypothetical protein